MVGKSSNTGSRAKDSLLGHTLQDGLFASELSSSLIEIRFTQQKFSTDKPVSDIKYHHPGSQNDNPFHLFNNQLNYALATYFVEFETSKGNIDRFLSNQLMALLTKKLSYRNANK